MTPLTRLRSWESRYRTTLKRRIIGPRCLMAGNWLVQFSILLLFIFFQGLHTPHAGVPLQTAPEDMAKLFGGGDSGSYLNAALDLTANGQNTQAWTWVLNLWPPGMVWLDAIIIRLSPLDFGVSIGLVTALVWSLPLSLLSWPFMRTRKSALIVLLVELAILGTSPFQSWMFDEGLFYSDGLAVAFYLLGLSLVVNRVRSNAPIQVWIRDGIYVGMSFAAALYFRAAFNLVPWALAAVAITISAVVIAKKVRRKPIGDLGRQAVLLIVATLTVPLLMQPYAAYVQQDRARTQFVMTDDLVYAGVWKHNTIATSPQWLLNGGLSVGCDIDPSECALIQREQADGKVFTPTELRNALIKSIATHPLQFLGNRGSYVARQWSADEVGSYSSSNNLNPGQGLLYLTSLIAAIVAAFILVARGRWTLLVIPIMGLAIIAPYAVVHVEVRYLIPLKMIGLLTPILLLMLSQTPRRPRRARPIIGSSPPEES